MTERHWQELLSIASELRRSGHVAEAIAAYKLLLAANPDLPDSWYNLGFLQQRARAFDEALLAYDRALQLGISDPEEVHLNRAVIFSDHLHRPEDAERELRVALAQNPDYLPALLNLGNLLEDLGRRDEARATYQHALAVDSRSSLGLARLAGVSLSPQLNSEIADRLRQEIAASRTMPAEKADLGFALAALLDAAGHYDEAFEAARAANQASRTSSGVRYDRNAVEQFVDRSLAATWEPARVSSNARAPVFICGMFRSGSTLVEQILAGHTAVMAGGELDSLPSLVSEISGYPESVVSADAEQIHRWREAYLRRLPRLPTASQLLTDKRPDNFLHVGFIKALFPEAKIVHTRRNPLDNLLSLYFLHLDPCMAYGLDLDDAAHWHTQYQRLMTHWKSLFADDIFDVDYDELVREPKPLLTRLLDFLSLERQDGLLDFYRNLTPVKTASVWQIRQPLHARSSGRWRNYERHLRPFEKTLGAQSG